MGTPRRGFGGFRSAESSAFLAAWVVVALSGVLPAHATENASAASSTDFSGLSIEELANIDVSSVSKADQPLSEAAAAIYVITHDDIIRSGARRLPEILRLAPNLQVAQVTAASYAISARGFNGTAASKLLVLIDGRSIYTPFFSGVFWDTNDVPPETIERIEVISGPGATLWGANAVNGVINIVTRNSRDTPGGVLNVSGGGRERRASLQYGGTLGEALTYRLYGESADHDHDVTASGRNARDGWRQSQAGFRLDWAPPGRDLLTLQGDIYDGSEQQVRTNTQRVSGHNLLARWTRQLDPGSSLQVQAYYDYLERRVPEIFGDFLHTYDLDLQHSFKLGGAHDIVWGGGYRRTEDRFPVVPGNISAAPFTQYFSPESRRLDFGDLFAQDTISLSPELKLTVGLKLENDPYSGLDALPSARLSWKVRETALLWAAVSRAVRAPSRLDRDFHQDLGSLQVITPGDFQPEELVAYELGYRGQPTARSSLSVSAFYNVYDKLRTFEAAPSGLPITIANGMEGETYGIEAWGAYQVRNWWRLSAGANWLHEDLRFKPGSSRLGGIEIAGDDPTYQASIRSSMALPHGGSLDLQLRRVGSLPAPASPAYTELNGRLAWAVTDSLELSITGVNLLHDHHPEFGAATSNVQLGATGVETARSVVVDLTWRFGN